MHACVIVSLKCACVRACAGERFIRGIIVSTYFDLEELGNEILKVALELFWDARMVRAQLALYEGVLVGPGRLSERDQRLSSLLLPSLGLRCLMTTPRSVPSPLLQISAFQRPHDFLLLCCPSPPTNTSCIITSIETTPPDYIPRPLSSFSPPPHPILTPPTSLPHPHPYLLPALSLSPLTSLPSPFQQPTYLLSTLTLPSLIATRPRPPLLLHGRQMPRLLHHHDRLLARPDRRHLRGLQHRAVPAHRREGSLD